MTRCTAGGKIASGTWSVDSGGARQHRRRFTKRTPFGGLTRSATEVSFGRKTSKRKDLSRREQRCRRHVAPMIASANHGQILRNSTKRLSGSPQKRTVGAAGSVNASDKGGFSSVSSTLTVSSGYGKSRAGPIKRRCRRVSERVKPVAASSWHVAPDGERTSRGRPIAL
jgi:hypothetical protein